MTPSPVRATRSFVVPAVAALALAACASAPPRAERYVPPPVGASADYRVTSTGSFGAGTSPVTMSVSEADWQGRPMRRFSTPAGSTVVTSAAGTVAVLDPAGRTLMRYDPPLDYRFPLSVGKTWTQDHVITFGNGTTAQMKASWRVEAYEKVKVPAGEFDAWRLVMTDSFGFRQTTWSVPEKLGMFARRELVRPAGHPQGEGSQTWELTRAPAVR